MDTWFKKLGYYENPFLINPFKERTGLIGQEQQLEDVTYYVTSGSLIFVEGLKGSGKTKFLRRLIDNFRGKIIYVDAAKLKKNLNIEELLRNKLGIRGKLFRKMPKDMILLLDNVVELSSVNMERLKYFYDQGYLQSVVFTGLKYTQVHFSESIRARIGNRIIKLDNMTPKQAIQLTLERLDEREDESEPLIANKFIEKIFTISKKNPRTFLINLHRVFEEMGFDDDDRIQAKHLDVLDDKLDKNDEQEFEEILGVDVISKEDQFYDEKGNKILKIGEYYRCPAEEMFCGNCGAIVKLTDKMCPECEAEFENSQPVEQEDGGEAHA